MGSICGVLAREGDQRAGAWLQAIAARMAHRCPQGMDRWDGGHLALASAATGPCAAAAQPLQCADGSVIVVAGRIGGRGAALRALAPQATTDMSDAALLALAWQRWREEMWRHVAGNWALAAWEPRAARLLLLRDHIGVQPCFWARSDTLFAFASEPEALLRLPGVSTRPNLLRLASQLSTFDDGQREATQYRDVFRVRAGELLEAGVDGRVCLRDYHRFDPVEPLRLASADAYAEAFAEVFDDAVADSIDHTGAPSSLMLSGGIDSAAVHASTLRQRLPLRRISVLAPLAGAEEERANIQAQLRQSENALLLDLGQSHLPLDPRQLAEVVFGRANPVRSSIVLPMLVYFAAAASGSRSVLDGIDGDLVMNAPDNYIGRMALAGRWRSAWRESRAAARTHTYLWHWPAWRILAWGLATRLEPASLAGLRYRLGSRKASRGPRNGLLHPALARELRVDERMLERRIVLRADPALRDWSGYRARVWRDPGLMRGAEGFDLAAAQFGLETRHPWLDSRVVDLVWRLPLDAVVRDGWTKWVARRAYEPQLGVVAWHSGKRHFGPAVTRLVLEHGRAHVDAALERSDQMLDGLVDPDAIAAARAAWRRGLDDPRANDRILQLGTLSLWLQALASDS